MEKTTSKELKKELRELRRKVREYCRDNGHEIYLLFGVVKEFIERETENRRLEEYRKRGA